MSIQKKLNPFAQTKSKLEAEIKYEDAPYLGFRLKKNQENIECKINQLGFRCDEVDQSKSSVLLVGNSTLYGSGLKQNELVSTILADRRKVNVLNLGMSGYTIKEEMLLLLDTLNKVDKITDVVFLDGFTEIFFAFLNKKIGYSPYYYDRKLDKKRDKSLLFKIKSKFTKVAKENDSFELPDPKDVVENYNSYINYIRLILLGMKINLHVLIQPSLYYVSQLQNTNIDDVTKQRLKDFNLKYPDFIEYCFSCYKEFSNSSEELSDYKFCGDLFVDDLNKYFLDTTHYTYQGNLKIADLIEGLLTKDTHA